MLRPTAITRAALWLLRPLFADALNKLKFRLAPERILENPYIAGKTLYPLQGSDGYYVLPKPRHPAAGTREMLPVPPMGLWEGYGTTEQEYLELGRRHTEAMIRIIGEAGGSADSFNRVLDFGCAAARMLRFYPASKNAVELWGLDIKANHIAWCQQHLGPPFLFATTTTLPHLPFADNYFDLVYCASVFTHIMDLPDAWFLELRRVVRHGGYLYITITDKHALDALMRGADRDGHLDWYRDMLQRFDRKTSVLSQDYGCFALEGGSWGGYPVPQVFYDIDYLTGKWSRLATLRSITPEAYGGIQTALLFQR